jgi:hypothetical protein
MYVAGWSFHVTGEGYGRHGDVLFEGKRVVHRRLGCLLETLELFLVGCNNAHLVLEMARGKS